MRTILRFFTFFTLSAFIWACSKNEPAPDLSKGYPEKFTNKVSSKKINDLKKAGFPINEGIDPPALDGVFKGKIKVINSSDQVRIGVNLSYDLFFKFSKFESKYKTCLIDWREFKNGKIRTFGGGGGEYLMSGFNNKFTIIGYEDFVDTNLQTTYYMTSYSGELTSNGIKDFTWGRFLLDKNLEVVSDAFEIYISQNGNFIPSTNLEGEFK
jgi:hypothetical protein